MKKLNVKKPFVFSHKDGNETRFAVGVHDISDEIASHEFIAKHKANGHAELIEDAPKPQKRAGNQDSK